MKCKTAYLIINPRLGKNVAKLTDMIALFSAAGWKTDTALKEFGGHTMQLAREAAEAGYDLVIGYGGDGTLNQVINGVMAARRRRGIVGVIPGGTANVWAHEIGMPEDPVTASLLLINSEGRKVDLGHVEVDSLPLPARKKDRQRKQRLASEGRHHFLLMAGLGIDAAILRRVSTPLKEKIGEAAVALAAAKELPSQHAFPIEIRSSVAGKERGVLWRGEALQVIVGNTRRYGNIAEVTPEAYIDDGVLDVCIITAGAPLTTIEQILSTLLHREPVNGRSEYFQGAHFWISVPAYVDLQLDGSRVKLKDCLAAPDRAALGQAEDQEAVVVTYRFDAMPRALRVAIPCTYDDALFEEGSGNESALATERQHPDQDAVRAEAPASGGAKHQGPEHIDALLEHGRKITVVGVGPNPERKGTYIVAGETSDKKTGESQPVAVRIDHNTTLVRPTGEPLSLASAAELAEGGVILVEGKQSKRGVIRAKRVVVVT
jgi:YegS/Rv2252/BmrU family lipid kinase